jgi:hypothetical protein
VTAVLAAESIDRRYRNLLAVVGAAVPVVALEEAMLLTPKATSNPCPKALAASKQNTTAIATNISFFKVFSEDLHKLDVSTPEQSWIRCRFLKAALNWGLSMASTGTTI